VVQDSVQERKVRWNIDRIVPRNDLGIRAWIRFALPFLVLAALGLGGCATAPTSTGPPLPSPGEPRIVDTLTGELLTPSELAAELQDVSVIYVGELHTNADHHRVQRDLLVGLIRQGIRPRIGLEMVERRHQRILNQWVQGRLTESALLSLLQWDNSWGHNFDLYRDIFDLARVHDLPLLALNAPRELVRKVGKVGRGGLTEEEKAKCPPLNTSNPTHQKYIRGFFGGHHGGHAGSFERFYQAQLVWDEFMAQQVAQDTKEASDKGPLVVFAGRAHIEFAHGIPSRAHRLSKASFRIVLPVTAGHLGQYAPFLRRLSYPSKRADYLWEATTPDTSPEKTRTEPLHPHTPHSHK
jgi:uncharacterized iron-regulated protein